MDRGVWWATVHGVTKESDTTERLKQQVFLEESISGVNLPKGTVFLSSANKTK